MTEGGCGHQNTYLSETTETANPYMIACNG